VTVHYRWHPLFGQTLEVRRYWRNLSASGWICQVPGTATGVVAPVPVWMTDKTACESLSFGDPLLSIDALCELRGTLDAVLRRKGMSDPNDGESADEPRRQEATSIAVERSGHAADEQAG
jgi:hypothetical protein